MSDIVFLASYPSFTDYERNFKCGEGRYIWHLWASIKGPRDMKIEFLYDDYRSYKIKRHRLTDIISRNKPKVIVAFGQDVINVLDIDEKISKCRGSVYKKTFGKSDIFIVPTYDYRGLKQPDRMFAEERIEKGVYTAYDLSRAKDIYYNGWEFPHENFILNPTVEQVEKFADDAVENDWLLGADLEGTGLDTQLVDIVMHGFAWSENDAIVIPETKEGGLDYWSRKDWPRVQRSLNKVYGNCRLMFQNGVGYDVPLIRNRGWNLPLKNFIHDTMVMHHTIHPESPHNIGFISSIYGKQPYWKSAVLDWKVNIHEKDQLEVKRYNARDCVALHQIRNGIIREVSETVQDYPEFSNFWFIYEKSMREARTLVKMEKNGILLNKRKLGEWNRDLESDLIELETSIRETYNLPDSFSLTSGDHKALWIFNTPIAKLDVDEVKNHMAYYDSKVFNVQFECPKCGRIKVKKFYPRLEEIPRNLDMKCTGKNACMQSRVHIRIKKSHPKYKSPSPLKGKSKDTNNYRELLEYLEIGSVKSLPMLRNFKPMVSDKTKKPQLDKKALTKYTIAINNRLDDIDNLKRRRDSHDEEEKELIELRNVINQLQKFNKLEKLRSSFTSYKTDPDGRVHPHFLITGTATGRLSCKKPNLQQIPSGKTGMKIRGCFQAGKGNTLISIDYENLEVWIGAYLMNDRALQKILEDGINFHDFNNGVFFGVTKDDPEWGTLRKAAKVIVFGRILYGGTDNGIYNNVMTAFPNCGLTLKKFKKAVQNYMDAHPDYVKWCKEVQEIALHKRLSVNGFGRVRQLLGDDLSIMRQALNSPVQGTAADVAREAMADCQEYIDEMSSKDHRWSDVKLLLQIHDELVFECPISMRQEVCTAMVKLMTKPITINGYTFNLKVDPEVGKYWGNQESYDYINDKINKDGSKH